MNRILKSLDKIYSTLRKLKRKDYRIICSLIPVWVVQKLRRGEVSEVQLHSAATETYFLPRSACPQLASYGVPLLAPSPTCLISN